MFIHLGIIACIAVLGSNGHAPQFCSTESGAEGVCISLAECSHLQYELQHSSAEEAAATLRDHRCGWIGKTSQVCCPVDSEEDETDDDELDSGTVALSNPSGATSSHPNLRLVNGNNCGPVSTATRITGGSTTSVLDFPWMALIAQNETMGRGINFACGGTLINKRYVLTAAHCITNLGDGTVLAGVRIGEHDIIGDASQRDCDVVNGVVTLCADRYQDFLIESAHPHSGFDPATVVNDIGLIRMDRDVDLRPLNARPICLPIGSAATLTSPTAIATGWGRTETNSNKSNTLLQAELNVIPIDVCARNYNMLGESPATFTFRQMCAGGTRNVCFGDSGGPLQYPGLVDGVSKYVQYGITSYGLGDVCGLEKYPTVFTSVAHYVDWILDTIRE